MVTSQCDHGSLDESRLQIRLLLIEPASDPSSAIQCSLLIHDLACAPRYEALSYCWGQEEARDSIELDGASFNIRPNLHQALKHLRLNDAPRRIWIDAICINQNDVPERNSQVKLMRQIYKNASQVSVWLGVEAEDSHMAAGLIEAWSQVSRDNLYQELASLTDDPLMFRLEAFEALEMVMSRPWWSRVWVYQEYVFAQEVWFRCGDDCWSADSLTQAFRTWVELHDHGPKYNLRPEHYISLRKASSNKFILISSHRTFLNTGEKLSAWKPFTNLIDIQHVTHTYDSTDPRDKLYALIGFDGSSGLIPSPDYNSSFERVYHTFAVNCLSSAFKLRILHSAGIGYANSQASLPLPSWVPDFRSSVSRGTSLLHLNFRAGDSPSHFSLCPRNLILNCEGISIDNLTYVVPLHYPDETLPGINWIEALQNLPYDHPAGIPLLQVLFRTMIIDQTEHDNNISQSTDAETRSSFFKFLVGFILSYGIEKLHQLQRAGRQEELIPKIQRIIQDASLPTYFSFFWDSFTPHLVSISPEQNLRLGLLRDDEADQWLSWLDEEMGGRTIEQDKVLAFNNRFTRRIARTTKARALVVTDRGYIGLAPSRTLVGDQLCCIFGCETPFILRSTDSSSNINSSRCQLVGQSYVYGLMHGEALREMEAGRLVRQRFEIV